MPNRKVTFAKSRVFATITAVGNTMHHVIWPTPNTIVATSALEAGLTGVHMDGMTLRFFAVSTVAVARTLQRRR